MDETHICRAWTAHYDADPVTGLLLTDVVDRSSSGSTGQQINVANSFTDIRCTVKHKPK
jgi:hypothetical protein